MLGVLAVFSMTVYSRKKTFVENCIVNIKDIILNSIIWHRLCQQCQYFLKKKKLFAPSTWNLAVVPLEIPNDGFPDNTSKYTPTLSFYSFSSEKWVNFILPLSNWRISEPKVQKLMGFRSEGSKIDGFWTNCSNIDEFLETHANGAIEPLHCLPL